MESTPRTNFPSLPAELRLEILSYYVINKQDPVYNLHKGPWPLQPGLLLDESYSSSSALALLSVCKQFRHDFSRLAFNNTHFVLSGDITSIPKQMAVLQPYHIQALRHISVVVADQTQFHKLVHLYPFDNPDLHLDSLSVVFQKGDYDDYPHSSVNETVSLLRRLENVPNLRFIRNGANTIRSFRAWFDALIGLMLKEDHYHRYDHPNSPQLPKVWWDWHYSFLEHSFELKSREPIDIMDEEEYMEIVAPLITNLMKDIGYAENYLGR